MSVLSIIQDHCKLHALAVPTAVIGSTDTQVVQLLAVLSESLDDMVDESKFNVTTKECVFVALPQEDQGEIAVLAGNGYAKANFETFYDRSLMRPLYGPVEDTDWQALKALPNPGPFYKFRIMGGHLLFNPTPTAPLSTIAFEYMSSWCVTTAAGVAKAAITADDDAFLFPEPIIRKFMIYRWKLLKGLPYQADQQKAYDMLNNYIATDKVKARINVAEPDKTIQPGVFVPAGNWMQ